MSQEPLSPPLDALIARAREALAHWDLNAQVPELLKYRENAVFRISLKTGELAALRLHRAGYHDQQTLASELSWMAALRQAGLRVPAPVPTPDGRQVAALAASGVFAHQYADIVSWMAGTPLGQSGIPLAYSRDRLAAIFRALGNAMARMHTATDAWPPSVGFRRPAWDGEGILGKKPLWGRFWDCKGLSPQQVRSLSELRSLLRAKVGALPDLDYGLIHADLVRENVLIDGNDIELIDFDDGGYGWRMFDIATALFKNRDEPHYALIETALIDGYSAVRPLPDRALKTLPLFTILRSLTYIGWIGARPETPHAAERLQRYATDTLSLANTLGVGV